VAEFENLSRADQLAFWAGAQLPIAALIDSGGKSIHAWIKIPDVYTPEQWRLIVKETLYRKILVDPACSNPARLSRFPGHLRAEKGNWQKFRLGHLSGALKSEIRAGVLQGVDVLPLDPHNAG